MRRSIAALESPGDKDEGRASRFNRSSVLVLLILLIAGLVSLSGHVRAAGSDPRGTMAVAQNILSHASLTLQGEELAFFRDQSGGYGYQVTENQGRIEYYFPIGPVLIALPVVGVANLVGIDAAIKQKGLAGLTNDAALQAIAMLACVYLILGIVYVFARAWFGRSLSASFAILTLYGTVIGPTVCSGFWSIDPEIVLMGLSTLAIRNKTGGHACWYGALLGGALFLGFLCRPTFALFILCSFAYLAIRNRRTLYVTMAVSAVLLSGFILFSEHHFGSYLPPYYLASRLSSNHAVTALYGLLLSPSRSVFIYSPILLAVPALLCGKGHLKGDRAWTVTMGAAIVLLFIANVFFPHWWGGYSFGPRILADMSFLACLLIIAALGSMPFPARHRMLKMTFPLWAVGLTINLVGLADGNTAKWNAYPSVDDYPAAIFDWRFPQALTISQSRLDAKCKAQAPYLPQDKKIICPAKY